jgi:hypothetical protein
MRSGSEERKDEKDESEDDVCASSTKERPDHGEGCVGCLSLSLFPTKAS